MSNFDIKGNNTTYRCEVRQKRKSAEELRKEFLDKTFIEDVGRLFFVSIGITTCALTTPTAAFIGAIASFIVWRVRRRYIASKTL